MTIELKQYTGGPLACNGYLVGGPQGWVAVDAPIGFAGWVERHLPKGKGLTDLLITHQHFDHVGDVAALQQLTGCRVHACFPYSKEWTLEQYAGWGIPPVPAYSVDDAFGTTCRHAVWGGLEWDVYSIPGHSQDGVAYGLKAAQLVFPGDILFAGAVGRTDFPGGSTAGLIRGIREHLLPLPPETIVLPGHGPETSIGEETLNNPYF